MSSPNYAQVLYNDNKGSCLMYLNKAKQLIEQDKALNMAENDLVNAIYWLKGMKKAKTEEQLEQESSQELDDKIKGMELV